MADVNANINIDIDSSGAIADLRRLQSEIGAFNKSVISANAEAALAQKQLNSQLINQVSAVKGFSSSITTVQSDLSRLGTAIDKNRLSLTEYFRYAGGASKTFGRMFSKEHNDVMALAEDRVKRLQTQYVALGQTQNGLTRALASRPMHLFNADMEISTQRQQLFNKLLRDGSTSMVNWGKNTQWAGRQLMVGFTVPVTIFGTVAGKVFMDLEKQIINFRRVYGDLGTTVEETEAMVGQIQTLGKEYTKYGIAVSDTIGLAAKAAAAGAQGADLVAATEQATRLATLGQVEQNQALTATIALQSAFEIGAKDLASTIDFLNAVENQTVVSLDDITIAIPKVAPVIRGLGGDVKDLSIFLAAMREGGVNAAEGANALKSGLASMINPTKAASEVLKSAGINMKGLIQENKGDLLGLVQDFGAELQNLDKFSRQQVLAKVFGKYQFARMGALFENINKDGSQAQRVLDLAGASMEDLAQLSEKELGSIENAVSVKFIGAIERLKLAIAPVGKKFMEIATPIIEFATKIAEKFSALPESIKTFLIAGAAIGAVLIPSIIMLVGLMANFLGNMLKIGTAFRGFMAKIRGGGDAFNYYEQQELDAMAAAASLDGKVTKLTTNINVQRTAVNKLASAYTNMATAARNAATMLPQGFRRPVAPRRMAQGGVVPGRGNGDTVPAMLTPGETVVTKEATEKYAPVLAAMNAGTLPGYAKGDVQVGVPGSWEAAHFGGQGKKSGKELIEWSKDKSQATQARVKALVDSTENGLEYIFTTFDNRVTALSREVNQAVGETGSGKTVSKSLAQRDLVDRGDVAHVELVRQLKNAGVSVEEIQGIVQRVTTEISTGFDDLGDVATVTAEDIDRIIDKAYKAVSSTDDRVDAAYSNMSNMTTVADPNARGGKQNRVNLEDSYRGKRETYNNQMGQVATGPLPYSPKGAIVINDDIARQMGATKREVAAAFSALDDSVKTRLAGIVGDVDGFTSTMTAELRAAGISLAEAALEGEAAGFQTSSPSEASAAIGDEVPRGAAVGIERSTPVAVEAARDMATQVAEAAAIGNLDQSSLPELRSQLGGLPTEGNAARMSRVGSYGGQANVIVDVASKGNAEIEAEVARLRSLQVDEKDILARVIDIEAGELAQRKVALEAAIIRKEQAEALATTGSKQASVQAATPAVAPITPANMPRATGFIDPIDAGPSSPVGGGAGAADNTDDQARRVNGLGDSYAKLAQKVGSVSIAATMAAGAFSGMGGPIGEVANSLFPLLGVLDLITIPMMFLGGGGGEAAGTGLAAAGAGGSSGAGGITLFGASLSGLILPITLIVAALAALVVAFKVTYDRFEPLRKAVSSLVDTFKAVAGAVLGELVGAFKQMFGITDKAGSAFGGFSDVLQNVANFLGPVFTAIVKAVSFQIQYLGNVLKIVIKFFQITFNVIKMLATIIVKSLVKGFQLLVGAIGWVLDKVGPLGKGFKLFGKMVADTFSKIPDIVKNAFSTVTGWIETAVNGAIAAINFLIEKYNSLPEWMRGDKIDVIANINLKYTVTGSIPSAESLTGGKNWTPGEVVDVGQNEEDGGDTIPDDTSGGSKEKSWLEQQNADMAANAKLYLDGQKIAENYSVARTKFDGVFARLRGMGVSQQILDALGTGEEGVKNAKELLGKGYKAIQQFIKNFGNANILGPAIEEARKKIAESAAKKKAGGLIDASIFGFTQEQKDALLGDQNIVAAINQAATQGKGPLSEYLAMLKQTADAADPIDVFQQKIDDLSLAQRLQTKPLDDQIDAYQKQIDKINEEINVIQELNNDDQDRIKILDRQKEMIQRQIDALERQNELDQRRIESLNREDALRQRTSDALSHELEQMSKQENEIKSTYEERVKALDNVSKINQEIINQQKQQLGLSQALSEGDIYAATKAVQEIRSSQANYASEQMKAGMQRASENAIAGLTTSGGLTREQAEQKIADIKEQSYQTSLQVRDIEDLIYQRNQQMIPLKDQQLNIDTQIRDINDIIYVREQEIKSIQDQRLKPLNDALKAQQDIKKSIDDGFKRQIDELNLRKDLADLSTEEADRVYNLAQQWKVVGDMIDRANKAARDKNAKLGDMPEQSKFKSKSDWQKAITKWNKEKDAIDAERFAAIQAVATPYRGGLMRYATGNVVGSGGRDSIPALLTPGEFVVRKSMVDKYGVSMLSKINQGAFSMPTYGVEQDKVGSVSTKKSSANTSAPVYNSYEVNVNVSGTNASADEIANKAVMRLQGLQNMQVRSARAN